MSGFAVDGAPTTGVVFRVDVDVRRHYYTAASHRPLVRSLKVTNVGYTGTAEEIMVSVRAEAVGAPVILTPWRRMYRVPRKNDSIDVDLLTLRPNMVQLASLDELVRGDVIVEVVVDGEIAESVRHPVEFLAYNQWFHSEIDYECLASFVLPNHPTVAEIMIGAREILKQKTGDGSTEGYQAFSDGVDAGISRVVSIVESIYEALKRYGIKYSNPPASFEGYGQKIRTPDVIMREKVMTCLDSTVLVASCIAAAGLKPLLFLVARHAFPGFWITPLNSVDANGRPQGDPLREPTLTNINVVQALDRAGLIGSFESTRIGLSPPVDFLATINRHKDFVAAHGSHEFEAVIDVERATMTGVRRLPNRVARAGAKEIEIVEEKVEDPPIQDASGLANDNSDDVSRERLAVSDVPPRIRRWMDALLDISNSNTLVNLVSSPALLPQPGKRSSARSIEIPIVDGLLAKIENVLFENHPIRLVPTFELPGPVLQNPTPSTLIAHFERTRQISLGPVADFLRFVESQVEETIKSGVAPSAAEVGVTRLISSEHVKEITRRFKTLKRHADEVEASSATNQLFLTVGSLLWESPGELGRSGKIVKSPLFVIPVRLSGSAQGGFTVQMEDSGELSPNYCLVEKLRYELGLHIPDLETPNLDDSGIDVDNMIARIRSQLSTSKFSTVQVVEDCQLAVLDFATFRMWKDLQKNWRTFQNNAVVKHLVEGSGASFEEDLEECPVEPLTPFDCDESQVKAVRWALEGRSFVLEGPPGTGKSQTIANMIAAGMAEGKRILFVAEKQVALEAVSRKLEDIGLDPFCITMHHESTTPESIRRQLQTSLEFVGQDVSAQWASESAVVAALRQRLDQYRDALIRTNDLGSNAMSATQEVVRLGEGPSLDIERSALQSIGPHLAEVRSALLQVRGIAGVSRMVPEPSWKLIGTDDPESIPKASLTAMLTELQSLVVRLARLRPIIEPELSATTNGVPPSVESAIRLITSGEAPPLDVATVVTDRAWISRFDDLRKQIESHKTAYAEVYSFFSPSVFTMDIGPQMAAATEAASSGFIGRKRKVETLNKLVAPLTRVPVDKEPGEILTLLQRVGPARDAAAQITRAYREVPHIQIPSDFDPMNEEHVEKLEDTVRYVVAKGEVMVAPGASQVRDLMKSGVTFEKQDPEDIGQLISTWRSVSNLMDVNQESETNWRNGRSLWDAIESSLESWIADSPSFTKLSRFALINKTLKPLHSAGLSKLVEAILSGEIALDDIHEQFERGLFRASRDERLNHGELATFDKASFDKTVADFTRKDVGRRRLMRTVIPRQLSEARPFKPGIRTGAIGSLERELGRKVRRVSVPKLIQAHGETITRLAPCFLMSPEAVSRLLPSDSQFFDLVIFDEASQIRVAAAIPAMGRAKAVVVVGDSKQMPPSKKIGQRQISTDDDTSLDDDAMLQDLESILSECSESHLPSLMLQCHFRSQHEGLIAFSNRNFYEGRLVTFPAPNTDRTTPITWIDVPDGEFVRSGEGKGTNPAEARAVVAEVVRRLSSPDHASKSIGIVTFNENQAAFISELLDEASSSNPAVTAALNHPKKSERLFVVPLEKVQGDERDTIMLSVSYSYQQGNRTRVSPTWGPLTNKGGERRLNVAITRSKQDMVVFCSFDPNHVSTTASSHLGVPATVEFLKECRDAAHSGGAALKSRAATSVDRFRKRLHDDLRNSGIKVRENVGLSKFRVDLAVSDDSGEEQFLAILLDTEEWAARSSAYDREVLPNSVLRLIGWRRIGRIWLKSAVEDPQLVIETVKNELSRERLRRTIAESLRSRGLEVRDDVALSQLGIDFAVRWAGQRSWPLAVTIAGPNLFSQNLNFEGDLPPEESLSSVMCLSAISLWQPDCLSEVEGAVEKIVKRLDQISTELPAERPESNRGHRTPERADQPTAPPPPQSAPIDSSPLLNQSEHWSAFADARSLPELGDQSMLGPGAGYNPIIVKRAIDEVVEFEGPISQDRLASIVVGRFGMTRVKSTRQNALLPLFGHLAKTTTAFGTTYWSSQRPSDSWLGFRTNIGEESRTLEEVPAEELSNAMVAVVKLGGTATDEEVLRFVSDGYERKLTEKVRTRLTEILAWTISTGRVVRKDGLLIPS